MGILSSLGGAVIGSIVDSVLARAGAAWEAYVRKEISKDELRAKMVESLTSAFVEVEKAYADSLSKTYATFMASVDRNKTVMWVWVWITVSQSVVLLWHQVGIPFYTFMTGGRYPSSGTTVEWAYALLTGLMGLGALALRGSSPSATADKLKGFLQK